MINMELLAYSMIRIRNAGREIQKERVSGMESKPRRAAQLCGRKVPSTKHLGRCAEDFDAVVAPTGWHRFAGAKCRQPNSWERAR
jgi:hypothetical protein